MRKKRYLNKKGFVSIEAIIAMVAVMFVMLLAIGFYGYLHPKIILEKEVQSLAQKAKQQGGLTNSASQPTNSDVSIFMADLKGMGYDTTKVTLTAVTNPGNVNCVGVTPLGSTGSNYLSRNSKQMIVITAKIPTMTKGGITAPLAYFGISSGVDDYYYIRETVMSERW
jgi:hypothetical protein